MSKHRSNLMRNFFLFSFVLVSRPPRDHAYNHTDHRLITYCFPAKKSLSYSKQKPVSNNPRCFFPRCIPHKISGSRNAPFQLLSLLFGSSPSTVVAVRLAALFERGQGWATPKPARTFGLLDHGLTRPDPCQSDGLCIPGTCCGSKL